MEICTIKLTFDGQRWRTVLSVPADAHSMGISAHRMSRVAPGPADSHLDRAGLDWIVSDLHELVDALGNVLHVELLAAIEADTPTMF